MEHRRKNPSRKAGASLGSDRGFVNKNVSTYPLAYRNAYQHRMEYIGEFCLSVAEQHLDCELGSDFSTESCHVKTGGPMLLHVMVSTLGMAKSCR